MRCVILCGGKGVRLLPLTKDTKKAFLPLGGKRVVDHIIDRLPPGMSYALSLNDNGALAALAQVAQGDEPVMVIGGDNFSTCRLDAFIASYQGDTLVGVYDVHSEERAKQFSVVELFTDGRIKTFWEKPAAPRATLVAAVLYIFPPHVFPHIHHLASCRPQGNVGEVIHAISLYQPVYTYQIEGFWCDIGTPEGYEMAKAQLKGEP